MKGREVRIVRNDCNLRIKYWWANTCILVSFVGPCRRRMSSWGYVHLRELCQPLTVGPWTFNSNEECLSSSPEKMNYSFTFVKLQFKCKKKKKKNESNIILKKNHNYREYLNFFLARRRILFFCYKKKLYFVARVLFFFFPRFYPQINSYFARLHSIVDKNGEDFHAIDNRFNVVKIIFGWTIKNVIWFVARYLGYQNYNRDRRVS